MCQNIMQRWLERKYFFELCVVCTIVISGLLHSPTQYAIYVFGPLVHESLPDYRQRIDREFPNTIPTSHAARKTPVYAYVIFEHNLRSEQIPTVLMQYDTNISDHGASGTSDASGGSGGSGARDTKVDTAGNILAHQVLTTIRHQKTDIRLVQADCVVAARHYSLYFTGESLPTSWRNVVQRAQRAQHDELGGTSADRASLARIDDGITSVVIQLSLGQALRLRSGALIYSVEIASPDTSISQRVPVVEMHIHHGG